MASADAAPYDGLSPDRILDALDSVDIRGDGRLLALNSFENRVYQVWRDDAPPVVTKFYRPARWTDAQIREEHAFVEQLVEREIPAVPAMRLGRSTLNEFEGFRFAVYDRHGGRAPELERRENDVADAQAANIRLRALSEFRILQVLTPDQRVKLREMRMRNQALRREDRLQNNQRPRILRRDALQRRQGGKPGPGSSGNQQRPRPN